MKGLMNERMQMASGIAKGGIILPIPPECLWEVMQP
jgi:hypothetical protein